MFSYNKFGIFYSGFTKTAFKTKRFKLNMCFLQITSYPALYPLYHVSPFSHLSFLLNSICLLCFNPPAAFGQLIGQIPLISTSSFKAEREKPQNDD
jgi:hypothetical protein